MAEVIYSYVSVFGTETSFSEDEFLQDIDELLPKPFTVRKLEDYQSDYGHLLPKGIGGDGDFGFLQIIKFVASFGTIEAFKLFAAAFLGRAGYLLADKLFKPIQKKEREAALDKEKNAHAIDSQKEFQREPAIIFDSEKRGSTEEKITLSNQRGEYSLKFYINEVRHTHSVTFDFQSPPDSVPKLDEEVDFLTLEKGHVVRSTNITYPLVQSPEELQKILNENFARILGELEKADGEM